LPAHELEMSKQVTKRKQIELEIQRLRAGLSSERNN
jgi:hypothetical protein